MKKLAIWKLAAIGVGFLVLISVGVLGFNVYEGRLISQNLEELNKTAEKLSFFNKFSKELILTNASYMDAIVDRASAEIDDDIIEQHKSFHKWFGENQSKYRSFLTSDEDKSEFTKTISELAIFRDSAESMFQDIRRGAQEEDYAKYDDVLDGTLDVVLSRNQKIIDSYEAEYRTVVASSQAEQNRSELIQWVSLFTNVVVGVVILIVLIRNINRALGEISSDIIKSVDHLKTNSDAIRDSSDQLSSSVAKQAANVQETVASADEINSMIQKTTEAAQSSMRVSSQSNNVAIKGKEIVDEMIKSIGNISKSNQDIMIEIKENNANLTAIVDVISQIKDKTKVINDIVFQTKLLSFNASVEAARAGESGKGFAVVAEEIGSLAEMSGKASTEISKMLETSTIEVANMAENSIKKMNHIMESGTAKIKDGSIKAKECGVALDEILTNVNAVNEMIKEIASASLEQSEGVQEIARAMQEIDESTHQNNVIAVESKTFAESLNDQVSSLTRAVEGLALLAGSKQEIVKIDSHVKSNVVKLQVKPLANKAEKVKEADFPSEDDPRFKEL